MILCQRCGGDGALRIPGGIRECPACEGDGTGQKAEVRRLQDLDRLQHDMIKERDEKIWRLERTIEILCERPLTHEEAVKALREAPEIPLTKEEIDAIVKKVTAK
jgi:RecJ-like exonuclease